MKNSAQAGSGILSAQHGNERQASTNSITLSKTANLVFIPKSQTGKQNNLNSQREEEPPLQPRYNPIPDAQGCTDVTDDNIDYDGDIEMVADPVPGIHILDEP